MADMSRTAKANIYTVSGVTNSDGTLRQLSMAELVMVICLSRAAEEGEGGHQADEDHERQHLHAGEPDGDREQAAGWGERGLYHRSVPFRRL
jgi:hypothetical protein